MSLSPQELAVLRTYQHEVGLRLSIYQPKVVLACRVNNSAITRGARTIAFNTVSSGSYTSVKSGMTCLVGSAPGKEDLGRIRVRSATSNSLVVAENSDILWANLLYLTVIDLFDLVAIFPRIIQSPGDPEGVIFYKDYDIAYTNQNTYLGSAICMGPHRAIELENGQPASLYYTATGTENYDSESLTYLWDFQGAVGITGSTALTPGNILYNTPGNFLTTLKVTAGNSTDTSYRYVVVEPPGGIIKSWEIAGLSESRSGGGWTAELIIRQALPFILTDGAVVILHTDEWYGSVHQAIGTNSPGCAGIFAVGYVLKNTITYDYEKSSVQFEIGSVSERMKQASGFAVSVESAVTPATWYQLRLQTPKRSILHFLKWHSTTLLTSDLQFVGIEYPNEFFDADRTSIYDGCQKFLASALLGDMISDRQGKLWCAPSISTVNLAKQIGSAEFTITKDDWIGEPVITEVPQSPVSYLEVGGIVFSGPQIDASTPLLSCAPGAAPSYQGNPTSITGLVLASQQQLNNLSGDLFAYRNARYPLIDMQMRTTFKNFNLSPQVMYRIIVNAGDTSAGIAINDLYTIDAIDWEYDAEQQTLLPRVTFRVVTEGTPGESIIIPVEAPTPGFTLPTFEVPSFSIPSFNMTFPGIPGTPPEPIYYGNDIAILFQNQGLLHTSAISPGTWINDTPTSFTSGEVSGLQHMDVCPLSGRAYLATSNSNIWTTILGTRTAVKIADSSVIGPTAGGGSYLIMGIGADPDVDGALYALTRVSPGFGFGYPVYGWKWAGSGLMTTTGYTYNYNYNNANLANITKAQGLWHYWTYNINDTGQFITLNSAFTGAVSTVNFFRASGWHYHVHARDADYAYMISNMSGMAKITAGGATNLGISQVGGPQKVATDPTGQYVFAWTFSGVYTLRKSSNYGITWENITSLPGGISNPILINMGDAYTWMVAWNSTLDPFNLLEIWITYNGGYTWADVTGDIATLIPANSVPIMAKRT